MLFCAWLSTAGTHTVGAFRRRFYFLPLKPKPVGGRDLQATADLAGLAMRKGLTPAPQVWPPLSLPGCRNFRRETVLYVCGKRKEKPLNLHLAIFDTVPDPESWKSGTSSVDDMDSESDNDSLSGGAVPSPTNTHISTLRCRLEVWCVCVFACWI